MKISKRLIILCVVVLVATMFAGCGKTSPTPSPTKAPVVSGNPTPTPETTDSNGPTQEPVNTPDNPVTDTPTVSGQTTPSINPVSPPPTPAFTPAPTVPGTIYVAPNGKVDGKGTIADPVRHIGKAVNMAKPGNTIILRGGVQVLEDEFDGTSEWKTPGTGDMASCQQPGTAAKPIIIKNYPGEKPVFNTDNYNGWGANGTQRTVFDIIGSYYTIEGIAFTGTQKFADQAGTRNLADRTTSYIRIDATADHVVINNCEFYQSFLRAAVMIGGDSTNCTVKNSSFHDINGMAILFGGRAENMETSNTATNNVVENCDIYRTAPGESITTKLGTGANKFNVFYTNNYRGAIYFTGNADTTVNTVRGCRIFQNEGGGIVINECKGRVNVEGNWIFQNGYQLKRGNNEGTPVTLANYNPVPTKPYTYLGTTASVDSGGTLMNSRGAINIFSQSKKSVNNGKPKTIVVATRNLIVGNSGSAINIENIEIVKGVIEVPAGRIVAQYNTMIANDEGSCFSTFNANVGYEPVFFNNLSDKVPSLGDKIKSAGNAMFGGDATGAGFTAIAGASASDLQGVIADFTAASNALVSAKRAANGTLPTTVNLYKPKVGSKLVNTGAKVAPVSIAGVTLITTGYKGAAPDAGYAEVG